MGAGSDVECSTLKHFQTPAFFPTWSLQLDKRDGTAVEALRLYHYRLYSKIRHRLVIVALENNCLQMLFETVRNN